MKIVLEGADRGVFFTVSELHALLPYACVYGSLRTSLRFLENAGAVVKEKAGSFTLVKPTADAYAWFTRAG